MKILGVETSCDETAAAVIEVTGTKTPSFSVLSNIVSSQVELHREYGGVYPMLAKREHEKNLPVVIAEALKKAGLDEKNPKIDAIALTIGPGLSPCLWTGITKTIELAKQWDVPVVPTDHMEGHLLVSLLSVKPAEITTLFPAVGLTVSGGHTQLILIEEIGTYTIIGETRDDAAGEAFDKTARILGLPYPGGPEIAQKAAQAKGKNTHTISLPRPMLHSDDYDFSFSGLKTAVLYQAQQAELTPSYVNEMAAAIQQAVIDVLVQKTKRATQAYKVKSVIMGGGVVANTELREQMRTALKDIPLVMPAVELTGDNAVMIAVAGYFGFQRGMAATNLKDLKALPNLRLS